MYFLKTDFKKKPEEITDDDNFLNFLHMFTHYALI